MGIGGTLRTLGRFLDACEAHGSVTEVELHETGDDSDVPISAAIDIEVPICKPSNAATELTPSETTLRPDGTLAVTYESEGPRLPLDDHDVDVDITETTHVDRTTTVRLRATVATEPSATDATEPSATDDSPRTGLDPAQDPTTKSTIAITVGGGDSQTTDETESTPPSQSPSERDVPPFRDTALLREVYESCDTFAEMPDALGMDVTAETVRRYMIRQGIHEPTTYNTSANEDDDVTTAGADTAGSKGTATSADTASGDDENANRTIDTESNRSDDAEVDPAKGDDSSTLTTDEADRGSTNDVEPPAVLADGIGLPEGVTIDTIVEAVQTSNTIYEVKQGIGVEREDALEMLKELNLLEFVAGRLATEAEREVGREQIIARLREQADTL